MSSKLLLNSGDQGAVKPIPNLDTCLQDPRGEVVNSIKGILDENIDCSATQVNAHHDFHATNPLHSSASRIERDYWEFVVTTNL